MIKEKLYPFLAQIRAKLHIFLVVMVELKDRGLK